MDSAWTGDRLIGGMAARLPRAGERGRVALMIVYSAASMGGVHTIGKSVGSALFLARLPASDVPFMFVIPGAATIAALFLYGAIGARVSGTQLVVGSQLVLLACMLVFRVLLATSLGDNFAVLALLFALIDTAATLVLLQFWTFAGEIFDVRQARRLFGMIAIGGTLSNIAAGVLLGALAGFVGVDNLLFAVAASLGLCAACAALLSRMRIVRRDQEIRPRAAARETFRTPVLRVAGWLTALIAILVALGTYQFFLSVHSSYAGDEAGLLRYLALFQVGAGLAALVVQLDVTARVMGRLGAFAALVAFPGAMAVGSIVSVAAQGGLAATTAIRAADPVFRHTINQAGLNVLYLPVRPALARAAKVVHGAIYALGLVAAGGLFLVLRSVPGWNYVGWATLTLAFVGLWLALLPRARRHYVGALAESVDLRRLDPDVQPIDLTDETTAAVLVTALEDDDEQRLLHALHLLDPDAPARFTPALVRLLDHPSPHVRRRVVTLVAARDDPAGSAALTSLTSSDDPEMRAAVAGSLHPGAAEALIGDPVPGVATAACVRVLQGGPNDAARRRLVSLLEDHDARVRRGALQAIASLPHLFGLEEGLIAALARPETAAPAAEAFVAFPRSAAAVLVPLVVHRDERLRTVVQRTLAKVRRAHPDLEIAEDLLREQCRTELRSYYSLLTMRHDLGGAAGGLLAEALTERMERALDRAFFLLAALHPDVQVEQARTTMRSDEQALRALAVEFVGQIADSAVDGLLGPIVDAPEHTLVRIAKRHMGVDARSADQRLVELASGADPWLAACALHRLGEAGRMDLLERVAPSLDGDPLVRETAGAARAAAGAGTA